MLEVKDKNVLLEKRVKKLEDEMAAAEELSAKDDRLHDELIDDLNAFIRQCNAKFTSEIGNINTDKMLKKTKSFKLIKALKEDWVNSARK